MSINCDYENVSIEILKLDYQYESTFSANCYDYCIVDMEINGNPISVSLELNDSTYCLWEIVETDKTDLATQSRMLEDVSDDTGCDVRMLITRALYENVTFTSDYL